MCVGGWVTESAWTFRSRAGRCCLSKGERGLGRGVCVPRWVSGGGVVVVRFSFPFFDKFFDHVFLLIFIDLGNPFGSHFRVLGIIFACLFCRWILHGLCIVFGMYFG